MTTLDSSIYTIKVYANMTEISLRRTNIAKILSFSHYSTNFKWVADLNNQYTEKSHSIDNAGFFVAYPGMKQRVFEGSFPLDALPKRYLLVTYLEDENIDTDKVNVYLLDTDPRSLNPEELKHHVAEATSDFTSHAVISQMDFTTIHIRKALSLYNMITNQYGGCQTIITSHTAQEGTFNISNHYELGARRAVEQKIDGFRA